MENSFKNSENEIVDFVVERLRLFKKIHYKYLSEVVQNRFKTTNVNELVKESLLKTNKAKLKRGYLLLYEQTSLYN